MTPKLKLRGARPEDCEMLWKWRNERATRKASFNTGYIPFETHKKWYEKIFKDPNAWIFIIEEPNGKAVGQVRFELEEDKYAEVDISIDRNSRGKGYAVESLKMASMRVLKKSKVLYLRAHVKLKNTASLKVFLKAGYLDKGVVRIKNQLCYKLIMERK